MSFDKAKAMRNAERFLSQGKIRSAISEYKKIVDNDPKDFSTMNILGDLYAKDNANADAVSCFKQVAEHFSKQGFAQKAIAIYNKISRLEPNSPDVSSKLAQLYQSRGSVAEARTHYAVLADQYQKKGQKAEALETWKQIAKLDPQNTEVYLKIAEFCVQNGQKDEAAKSYTEAGTRLAASQQYESALTAFSRALDIRQYDLGALNGYVKAQIKLGYADEAAARLEKILAQSPYNREILYLLVDCHLDSGNYPLAETAVIRLVEQEPANYPKFIELVEVYVKTDDLVSAARILSMSSEHLLVGGRHEEFLHWANEILARDASQIDALRLLVRYYSWQRDETELRKSLERLAESARLHDELDDEKYALSQLVLIAPHEIGYARRLQEINYGSAEAVPVQQFSQPADQPPAAAVSDANSGFAESAADVLPIAVDAVPSYADFDYFGSPDASMDFGEPVVDSLPEFGSSDPIASGLESTDADPYPTFAGPMDSVGPMNETIPGELSATDEMRLSQEIESVEFYISQGYRELADKALSGLEAEFGHRPEIVAVRSQFEGGQSSSEPAFAMPEDDSAAPQPTMAVPPDAIVAEPEFRPPTPEPSPFPESPNFLDEFRIELGLEEPEKDAGADFETHYHTAVAYQEMGLLEDSIREFQDAVNLVTPGDGTRRFFQCCNLLGHCFMQKSMPNLALMWFRRALETPALTTEESQAMAYEIANAYEIAGETDKAVEYFEQIYAINVDYRDVGARLHRLQIPTPLLG